MTPYPLFTPVTATTVRDGAICRVTGEIRARTAEDHPHYDVMASDGAVISNVPHADIERQGEAREYEVSAAGIVKFKAGWPMHVMGAAA
jgi:hypothetical protein